MELFGRNGYCVNVIYDPSCDEIDKNAVYEICLWLKQSTKKDIHSYSYIPSGKSEGGCLFVGSHNRYVKEMGITVPYDQFEEDTVYILVKNGNIVLDGGIRGKLYAIYEFAERFLGIRFYAPDHTKIPDLSQKVIELDDCEILYTPPFKYRHFWSHDVLFDRVYANRVRANAEYVNLAYANMGGGLRWAKPDCHTIFQNLMPPDDEKYGYEKHPEFYSYVKEKNARVGREHNELGFPWGEGDVCWSNPQVIDIVTDRVKKWILKENDMEIFSITQTDYPEHCECEECTRLATEHGVNGKPRWSALYVTAVNEIARRIKKWQREDERVKNRTIYLETFAYNYSVLPPIGIAVEDNVIIRICGPRECVLHPLGEDTCDINKPFMRGLDDWHSIAKNIYIWTYSENAVMPIAYTTFLNVIQKNLQYFAQKNILGIFNEYTYFEKSANLYNVRQYLYAKLMWDPNMDFETEYKEVMEYYYGDGAACLAEIERIYINHAYTMEKWHPIGSHLIMKSMFPKDFFANGTELFETALQCAKNAWHRYNINYEYAIFKWLKMYVRKGQDMDEMKRAIAELEFYQVPYSRMEAFKKHFFEGIKDDYFLEEIEERNRAWDIERIDQLANKTNGLPIC